MLRLRALHVMGHGCARIAEATGASHRLIQRIVGGEARTVSPALRVTVARVYDRWWDKRAPERTRSERAAAGAARSRARRGGWSAPAALDDDQLDRPGYQPPHHGWLPATGTGTVGEPSVASSPPRPAVGPEPGRRPASPPGMNHDEPVPGGDTSKAASATVQGTRQTRETGRSPRAEREAQP
jgi:hypothetical protein